ncbi:MAG TPA: three-Cys-motif partner protein TcmP [Puia sp.]|nr:three-Cys-motif partner protein TcmP [Puia sp.]
MNQFGGNWTEAKIEMIVSYAKAYLIIMNKYPQFEILYFDGFAGSGDINEDDKTDLDTIKGAAVRILEIDTPKPFDLYYFVEMNEANAEELKKTITNTFPDKKGIHVVRGDCNNKLVSMAEYLKKRPSCRVLAFIDPYGMSVNWSSIEILKGLGIDLWILVPTGIGVSRLLKRDGNISEAWLNKLEKFLGISRDEIIERFYKKVRYQGLFDLEPESLIVKESNVISRIHNLYKERLQTVFKYVSDAFVLRNSRNSVMYHFMMASNNTAALKIANDIVKPKFKL